MAKQAVSLVLSGTGLTTALGATALEITDIDISDLSIDDLETTHQGTAADGALSYRTYIPNVLRTAPVLRVSLLYNGGTAVLGTPIADLAITLTRPDDETPGDMDIPIIKGPAYLKSFKITGTLGEIMTAEAEFKFTGLTTIYIGPLT